MKISPFSISSSELAAMRPPGDAAYVYERLLKLSTWSDEGPVVGKRVAGFVDETFDLALPKVVSEVRSTDGSTKLLFELADGARIETVHMPRAVRNPRTTLCLSSQVGCAMGCTFCHTATMGFIRNLTAAEIVAQALVATRRLGPPDSGRWTIVFMGMGEPLHNLDAVLKAVEIFCDPLGLRMSPQRITVSTSGLVPGIEALGRARVRPCLALSLNATTNEARSRTMPITKKHNLESLAEALQTFPLRPKEKVTIEYVLLAGENDSIEDAKRLADFARPLRHNINVIPYNVYDGSAFAPPSEPNLQTFVRALMDAGCFATIRRSRGRDAQAACGQLAVAGVTRPLRRRAQ